MANSVRAQRQPLIVACGLVLLVVVGLLIARVNGLSPTRYVEALAGLPIPANWELAASRAEGFNPSVGPNERRYYLIDGDPQPIWTDAVALLEGAGYVVTPGWQSDCRRNGAAGAMTCTVVAEREDVTVWISVNERGSVTDVQDDPTGREVGRPGFTLLVMQASAGLQ